MGPFLLRSAPIRAIRPRRRSSALPRISVSFLSDDRLQLLDKLRRRRDAFLLRLDGMAIRFARPAN